MSTIAELSKQIHYNASEKGFWDKPRNIGEVFMLIVSEISEALEADRKDHYADWSEDKPPIIHASQLDDEMYKEVFENQVKNTLEDELADAMIRIMDFAYHRKIDLQWHIEAKMRYNSLRPHMHGKKY